MSEDWRLQVSLHEHGLIHALTERLEATDLEHSLESEFHDRVAISRDSGQVFCYTDSRQQAERVEQLIRSLASEHDWHLETQLRRWHPVAEEWEDPEAAVPTSPEELAAEHEQMVEDERKDALARGYPDFEVRIDCRSHGDAVALAERLDQEGIPTVRRSRYVLVGAFDEDSAAALAERLRAEAPEGATVTAEGTLKAVEADRPPNPFAIFGGLADA